MYDEICVVPATELAALIRRRALSPVEVVEAFLARIEARGSRTNAFVTVTAERALSAAAAAERAVTAGADLGPLHGVPVAIKDMVATAGVRTTFGSRVFADHVPDADGTEVTRLVGAGAIVLGKTNTPEFAARGTTDNFLFGPTSTPFAPGKNAGGSSGGSAAAVADGLAPLAQGSDGGGSIRIPAAWCGVYGIKPTYGRVASAWRPNAFATHTPFLHSGPLTRTVDDAALMLTVMSQGDPRDPLALPATGDALLGATRRSLAGLRIGYSRNLGDFPVDPQVAQVIDAAVRAFEQVGATVDDVHVAFPYSHEELSAAWLRQVSVLYAVDVALYAQQGIGLLTEHRDELCPELVEIMELGARQTAVEYRLDDVIRTGVLDVVEALFERYDLLVCPTVGALPVDNATDGNTLGPTEVAGQTVDPIVGWCLTHPFNFTGHPAASVPAGFADGCLPVGLQIIGPRFADSLVLAASAAFERVRPWHGSYPPS